MQQLWEMGEARVNELLEACNAQRPEPVTRNTLLVQLERLEAKGWIQRERGERSHVFRPAVQRQEGLRHATREFLDRFFGGALTPLLAHCVEEKRLSQTQIAELRALLDAAEKDSTTPRKK